MGVKSVQDIFNEAYGTQFQSVQDILNAVHNAGWKPANVVSVANSGGNYTSIQEAVDAVASRAGWSKQSLCTHAEVTVYPSGIPENANDTITLTVYRLGEDPVEASFKYVDIAQGQYTHSWGFARAINEKFLHLGLRASCVAGSPYRVLSLDAIDCVYFTVTLDAGMQARTGAPAVTTTDVWLSDTPEVSGAVVVHSGTYSEDVRLHSNVKLIGKGKPVISGDFAMAPGYTCEWENLFFQPDPAGNPGCIVQMDYLGGKVNLHDYNAGEPYYYNPPNDAGQLALVSMFNSTIYRFDYLVSLWLPELSKAGIPMTVGVRTSEIETGTTKPRADYIRKLARNGCEIAPEIDNLAGGTYPIAINSVRDALKRYVVNRHIIENLVDTRFVDAPTEWPVSTQADTEWSRVADYYKPLHLPCRGLLQDVLPQDSVANGAADLDALSSDSDLSYLPNKIRLAAYQWSSGNIGVQSDTFGALQRYGFRATGMYDLSTPFLGRWTTKKFDFTEGQTTLTFELDVEAYQCNDGLPFVVAGDEIGNDDLGFKVVVSVVGNTVTVAEGFAASTLQNIWNKSRMTRVLTDFGRPGRQTVLQVPQVNMNIHKTFATVAATLQRAELLNCVTVSGMHDSRNDIAIEGAYPGNSDIDTWATGVMPNIGQSVWDWHRGYIFYGGAEIVNDGTHNWIEQAETNYFRIRGWVQPGHTYKIRWIQRSDDAAELDVFGCYGEIIYGGSVTESITRGHTLTQTLVPVTGAEGEVHELLVGMRKCDSRIEAFFCPLLNPVLFRDITITRL